MFEVGFTEILVISVLALVVLGPEKLPRVAAQIGKWVGRARAMARQFREQLEEEVDLAETNKARAKEAARAEQDAAAAQSGAAPASTAGADATGADASTSGADAAAAPAADTSAPASTQHIYTGVTGEQDDSHSGSATSGHAASGSATSGTAATASAAAASGASSVSAPWTPSDATETAHSDANGPPPEPEASVYQPPRYAHAGAEDTYGAAAHPDSHASTAHAGANGSAEPSAPSTSTQQPSPSPVEPKAHDDDPPRKPGDFIIHTHERGI